MEGSVYSTPLLTLTLFLKFCPSYFSSFNGPFMSLKLLAETTGHIEVIRGQVSKVWADAREIKEQSLPQN